MLGRPPKPPDQVRSLRIRVRFSDEELAEIKEHAQGNPLPEFIRKAVHEELGRPSEVPQPDPKVASQLARSGNYLNQLVRLAHTGHVSDQLEPMLRRLDDAIDRYRRELERPQESPDTLANRTPQNDEAR